MRKLFKSIRMVSLIHFLLFTSISVGVIFLLVGCATIPAGAPPRESPQSQDKSVQKKVLIDASKDLGEWWGKVGFDPMKPHQGKELADALRDQGWQVDELSPGETITTERLLQYFAVIRPRPYTPYSKAESEAYSLAVNKGLRLLLLGGPTDRADRIAAQFGIYFGRIQLFGRIDHYLDHPLVKEMFGNDALSVVIDKIPADWLTLAFDSDKNGVKRPIAGYSRLGLGAVLCFGTSHLANKNNLVKAMQFLESDSPSALMTTLQQVGLADSPTSGPSAPELVSPKEGAILPQPSQAPWSLEWRAIPEAIAYQLVVYGQFASVPLVNTQLEATTYIYRGSGGYIAGHNLRKWTWQVRARNQNSQWGEWSEIRTFDITPREK
jgi:hypothetical protein